MKVYGGGPSGEDLRALLWGAVFDSALIESDHLNSSMLYVSDYLKNYQTHCNNIKGYLELGNVDDAEKLYLELVFIVQLREILVSVFEPSAFFDKSKIYVFYDIKVLEDVISRYKDDVLLKQVYQNMEYTGPEMKQRYDKLVEYECEFRNTLIAMQNGNKQYDFESVDACVSASFRRACDQLIDISSLYSESNQV